MKSASEETEMFSVLDKVGEIVLCPVGVMLLSDMKHLVLGGREYERSEPLVSGMYE